jgi:LysM repeat protein
MKICSTVIFILILGLSALGQDFEVSGSTETPRPKKKILTDEQKAADVFNKAGILFKSGLTAMSDNRRAIASKNFDNSIEVFLMSGIDVQLNQKLRECYNQLIETVYRIEFPSNDHLPQVRSLSTTCNWDIKNETADSIGKLISLAAGSTGSNNLTVAATNKNRSDQQIGFNEQKFVASPLDEVAAQSRLEFEGRTVKVKPGDSLSKIAQREGVSLTELAKYNGLLTTSAALPAGREIKIPGKDANITYVRPDRGKTTSAQFNSCTESDSPIIQGLRFRTTLAEIERDTKLKLTKVNSGRSLSRDEDKYIAEAVNANVKSLYLGFYKNQLEYINVIYSDAIKWNSPQEFVQKVSESLNVSGEWKITTMGSNKEYMLSCTHFTLFLGISGFSNNNNELSAISKDISLEKLKDYKDDEKRKSIINQKKKETFQP